MFGATWTVYPGIWHTSWSTINRRVPKSSCFPMAFQNVFIPQPCTFLTINSLCYLFPFPKPRTPTLAHLPGMPTAVDECQEPWGSSLVVDLSHPKVETGRLTFSSDLIIWQMCCPRAQALSAIFLFLALVPFPHPLSPGLKKAPCTRVAFSSPPPQV